MSSIDLAESYFARLRALIGANPSRYVPQVVVFCGEGPYSVELLHRLLPPWPRWYDQDSVPPGVVADTVVVGWWGASLDRMAVQLRTAALSGVPSPRFLPQEGFVDDVLFGHDWWTTETHLLNACLAWHEGLRIAHALHVGDPLFLWPSLETDEHADVAASTVGVYRPETELHRLGYRITGLTREERWLVLTESAIPALGLQTVAGTIASLVRLRKTQRGGREKYRRAIAEWEHDMDRMKREYWQRLAHRFPWPGLEV